MKPIGIIEKINGPTLTIPVPADLAGAMVEVIISPLKSSAQPLAPNQDPRYAPYILPKPTLTKEQFEEFERNPHPLRRTGGDYLDPYEPAVPPEDWEVYQEDTEAGYR